MVFYEPKDYTEFSTKVPNKMWIHSKENLRNVTKNTKSKSKKRILIKHFVYFMCIAGCLYQVGRFMELYYAYPTSLNIIVEHKAEMQPPGVTVCNSNRFRRSAFCKMFPERCYSSTCYYPYNETICNEDEEFLLPKPNSDKEFEKHCNKTLNILLGHNTYPFIKRLELLPTDDTVLEIKKNYTMVPMSEGVTCPRNCFLLNSLLLNPYGHLENISLKTEERKIMKIFLDLEPEEYLHPQNSIEGLVHLHSPFVTENPYIHGFIIKPGNIYYVDIEMIEKFMLPLPYDTTCEDYFREWVKEKVGPLSWEMCVQYCKINKSTSACGCVPNRIIYPHEERFCIKEDKECIEAADLMKCYNMCQKSCYQRKFQYTVASKEIPKDLINVYQYIWDYEKKKMRERAVIMIFTLREPETLVYRSSPEYETIEFFSYLGGYTGMWLGVSAFTIFEYVESMVVNYYKARKERKTIPFMKRKNSFRLKINPCPKHRPRVIKRVEITHLF